MQNTLLYIAVLYLTDTLKESINSSHFKEEKTLKQKVKNRRHIFQKASRGIRVWEDSRGPNSQVGFVLRQAGWQ